MQDFFHQQYHSCLGRNDNASYCSWWQLQCGNRKPKMYHKRWRVITAMVKVFKQSPLDRTTSTLSPCKVYYLPAQGCLSIGRRADCEVRILGSFSKHLGGIDAHHEHQGCERWLHHQSHRPQVVIPRSVVSGQSLSCVELLSEMNVECPPWRQGGGLLNITL